MIKLTYRYPKEKEVHTQEVHFSKSLLKAPYSEASLFVISVQGRSMEPHILDGSIVVADLSRTRFEPEAVFLVQHQGQLWIKKARLIEDEAFFVSLNPEFEHLVYALDQVRIVAKALLTFTNL